MKKITKTQLLAIQKKLGKNEAVNIRLCCSNIDPNNGKTYDTVLKHDTDIQTIIDYYCYLFCIDNKAGRRIHFYLVDEV